MLMKALIIEARDIGKHVMVAVLKRRTTPPSIFIKRLALLRRVRCRRQGTKFGRWLDLTFAQLQSLMSAAIRMRLNEPITDAGFSGGGGIGLVVAKIP